MNTAKKHAYYDSYCMLFQKLRNMVEGLKSIAAFTGQGSPRGRLTDM